MPGEAPHADAWVRQLGLGAGAHPGLGWGVSVLARPWGQLQVRLSGLFLPLLVQPQPRPRPQPASSSSLIVSEVLALPSQISFPRLDLRGRGPEV